MISLSVAIGDDVCYSPLVAYGDFPCSIETDVGGAKTPLHLNAGFNYSVRDS